MTFDTSYIKTEINKIDSFLSFCMALRKAGFSLGGSNDESIFSLCSYFSDNLISHTGNKETDPWEWRIRGISENDDLAYGKLFFNKGGWITREWFPYFMAVRRKHKTFDEIYREGSINYTAKRIYDLICQTPGLSLHEIKLFLECGKMQSSEFEAAINKLQMQMFILINGEKYKISKGGKEYGWPVTTFCTVEDFFGGEIFEISCSINQKEAADKISEQILFLNPKADTRMIKKFISG